MMVIPANNERLAKSSSASLECSRARNLVHYLATIFQLPREMCLSLERRQQVEALLLARNVTNNYTLIKDWIGKESRLGTPRILQWKVFRLPFRGFWNVA